MPESTRLRQNGRPLKRGGKNYESLSRSRRSSVDALAPHCLDFGRSKSAIGPPSSTRNRKSHGGNKLTDGTLDKLCLCQLQWERRDIDAPRLSGPLGCRTYVTTPSSSWVTPMSTSISAPVETGAVSREGAEWGRGGGGHHSTSRRCSKSIAELSAIMV